MDVNHRTSRAGRAAPGRHAAPAGPATTSAGGRHRQVPAPARPAPAGSAPAGSAPASGAPAPGAGSGGRARGEGELPVFDSTVLTERRLRAYGIGPAAIAERCRPGGPWRRLLPRVYLLHPGPPSSRERAEAALLFAGREPYAHGPLGGGREAVLTGLAALALHGFGCVPPLAGLPRIDVLVARQRRLRAAGDVTVHRARALPRPQEVAGLPCAPVPRALADAVAGLDDADTVRMLLVEAVRGGYADALAIVAELAGAGLLDRPDVAGALPELRAADRTAAEAGLYAMVRTHGLPEPLWNVELYLPGGPQLGGVDAYWPQEAVAVVIDARAGGAGVGRPGGAHPGAGATGVGRPGSPPPRAGGPGRAFGGRRAADDDETWAQYARQRERLEALGIAVVHVTGRKLREAAEQQAAVVRTALVACADRVPAAYVVVRPR